MQERLVLKNGADCTSQRLKRNSGGLFCFNLCFFVVFEPREYARTTSLEKLLQNALQQHLDSLGSCNIRMAFDTLGAAVSSVLNESVFWVL